jgi:hemoglobin
MGHMPSVPDLDSREHIDALLVAFYDQALEDEVLGPVFRAARMELVSHLPRIAAFWEKTLLGTGHYDGRPMQVHRHLMQTAGLAERHFARWLQLWQESIHESFAGPRADQAAEDAVRIGEAMLGRPAARQDIDLISRPTDS